MQKDHGSLNVGSHHGSRNGGGCDRASDYKLSHPHERLMVVGKQQAIEDATVAVVADPELKMKESLLKAIDCCQKMEKSLPDLSFVYKLPDARRSKKVVKRLLDKDLSPPKTTWFRVGSSSSRSRPRRTSSSEDKIEKFENPDHQDTTTLAALVDEENDDSSSVLSSQMERLSESIRNHLEELQQVDEQLLEDAANARMDLIISGRQHRRASAPAVRQQNNRPFQRSNTTSTSQHRISRNSTRTSTPSATKGMPRRCVTVPSRIYVTLDKETAITAAAAATMSPSPRSHRGSTTTKNADTPRPSFNQYTASSRRRRSPQQQAGRMLPALTSNKLDETETDESDYDASSSSSSEEEDASSTCAGVYQHQHHRHHHGRHPPRRSGSSAAARGA